MKEVKKSPKKHGMLLNSHVIHSQIGRKFANDASMKLTNHETDPGSSDSSPDYSPGNSVGASSSSKSEGTTDTTSPSGSDPGSSSDSASHPEMIAGGV